jgi:hypothetical protein
MNFHNLTHRFEHWPVEALWCDCGGAFWATVFGYGLQLRDHNQHAMFFSEREGINRGLHVGSWCLRVVR